MKKLFLLFSVLCLLSCSSDDTTSSVTPGSQDIYITTSEEFAAFAAKKTTHLEGSLYITGDIGSDDLSELESLQQVDGVITFFKCINLIKLSGLHNLTKAGGVIIVGNEQLISLDGLNGITSITGEFRLESNSKMKTLEGIDNLTTVKYLILKQSSLTSISALHSLTTAETIRISGGTFTTLGLNKLTSVKNLEIYSSYLVSLQDLSNLALAENITIETAVLTNLHGLEKITTLKTLRLYNQSLISLDGLKQLQKVDLLLLSGNNLTSLDELQSLTTIGSDAEKDGLYITNNNLQSLDALSHVTNFKGSFYIDEDLTNFCPLQNILSKGQLSVVRIERNGKPVPSVQDIINGNCTAE